MMADVEPAIAFSRMGAGMFWPVILLVLAQLFFFLPPVVGSTELGIQLATDKAVYRPGEPVVMRIKLSNLTDQARELTFNTSQRYDFSISDSAGREIWRWSKDKMFLMVLGQEQLNKERKELSYSHTFTEKLPPGRYTITGKIVSQPQPFAATTVIIIN